MCNKACIKKYKTIVELAVSLVIFIPLVLNGSMLEEYTFFNVVHALLGFIIILELIRMLSQYIVSNHVELRLVFDTFIIFLTREIVLLYSNKSMLFEMKVLYALLGLVIITFLFYFRRKGIETQPTKDAYNNCEGCSTEQK